MKKRLKMQDLMGMSFEARCFSDGDFGGEEFRKERRKSSISELKREDWILGNLEVNWAQVGPGEAQPRGE